MTIVPQTCHGSVMAKIGAKEQANREMQARRLAESKRGDTCGQVPRGGGESNERASRPASAADEQRRPTAQGVRVPKAKADMSGQRSKVGVATSPRGYVPKRGNVRVEDRDKTLAATKPWEAEVPPMSRRTWYRRQAETAKKNA